MSTPSLRGQSNRPIESIAISINRWQRQDDCLARSQFAKYPGPHRIGRKIREAFRPQLPDWSYLAADYSQIELRLLAHLSEDPILIMLFKPMKISILSPPRKFSIFLLTK